MEAKPPIRKKSSSCRTFSLLQQWPHPNRASINRKFYRNLGPTRVWLACTATSTFPEGHEWDFLRLKEKSPFLPTSPVSSLTEAHKKQAAGFLPLWRSDVAKGKSSHSRELTQRSLCTETNGLQLSEHNPWQGSASARWFLSCPSSSNFSLNLLRRQKGCGKLCFHSRFSTLSVGTCYFPKAFSWWLCVCLDTAPRAPRAAFTAHLRCGIYFLSSVNTWEGKQRNWDLFFKLVS